MRAPELQGKVVECEQRADRALILVELDPTSGAVPGPGDRIRIRKAS